MGTHKCNLLPLFQGYKAQFILFNKFLTMKHTSALFRYTYNTISAYAPVELPNSDIQLISQIIAIFQDLARLDQCFVDCMLERYRGGKAMAQSLCPKMTLQTRLFVTKRMLLLNNVVQFQYNDV